LEEFQKYAFERDADLKSKTGFIAMRTGCQVFHNLTVGVLPVLYDIPKVKECCMQVAAAMDLVRYIRNIKDKSKLKKIKEHLALIGVGGFGIAATFFKLQSNQSCIEEKLGARGIRAFSSEVVKDAARKTIELMLGLAALNTFDDIALENPSASNSKNPNPDLIIKHANKRYGVACKSLTCRSFTTLKERIEEGIEQIDNAVKANRIDGHCGIVLLDVSALLDQDALYMPAPNTCWDIYATSMILMDSVDSTLVSLFGVNRRESIKKHLGQLFKNHQASPAVLVYAHSLMITSSPNGVSPCYMKAMRLLFAGDTSHARAFFNRLNNALHCQ